MQNLFEFYSFLLAAVPFRFIYFIANSWLSFLEVISIKFIYKGFMHILAPIWSKPINQIKCKLKKLELNAGKPYFAIGESEPLSYENFMTRIASKFAFQQFNDIFDIVIILVLMSLSYGVSSI